MNRRLVGLLCFVLALAFAANTLWLFPHADEPRYEYRAVELNESNARHYIDAHPSVRRCITENSRTCGFELRARDEPVALDVNDTELYADYKYVATRDGYVAPTVQKQNGTVSLSSRNASEAAVLSDIAYSPTPSVTRYDRTIQKAIEDGRAVSSREVDGLHRIVRDGGRYYVVQDSWISDPLSSVQLLAVRTLLWLTTVPLSTVGFVYRYG
ncbi:hypothetical protein [Haladaptatus sp. NG-WS-4]